MPQISSFYGITIYMYGEITLRRTSTPSTASTGRKITIAEGHLLAGSLPPRALRMVRGWRRSHENELRENWARVQRPEPPIPVEPLP